MADMTPKRVRGMPRDDEVAVLLWDANGHIIDLVPGGEFLGERLAGVRAELEAEKTAHAKTQQQADKDKAGLESTYLVQKKLRERAELAEAERDQARRDLAGFRESALELRVVLQERDKLRERAERAEAERDDHTALLTESLRQAQNIRDALVAMGRSAVDDLDVTCLAELDKAERYRAAVGELVKYAQHEDGCSAGMFEQSDDIGVCECGLDDALESAQDAAEGGE